LVFRLLASLSSRLKGNQTMSRLKILSLVAALLLVAFAVGCGPDTSKPPPNKDLDMPKPATK
jgi:hypothetical protein